MNKKRCRDFCIFLSTFLFSVLSHLHDVVVLLYGVSIRWYGSLTGRKSTFRKAAMLHVHLTPKQDGKAYKDKRGEMTLSSEVVVLKWSTWDEETHSRSSASCQLVKSQTFFVIELLNIACQPIA